MSSNEYRVGLAERELLERLQEERKQGLRQRIAMQFTLDPEQPNRRASEA